MSRDIFQTLETAQHELFLFSAVFMFVGALSELCVDAIWAVRRICWHIKFHRTAPPLLAQQLPPPTDHGILAVFVPVWCEAMVIGAMLHNCTRSWSASNCQYRIFVGCYPNDPQSVATVIDAASSDDHIRLVMVGHDGPTTKADCLNQLWHALLADEIAGEYRAKAIILHDAEDAVHPDELHVFNCLVPKGGAVQLPVIPVRTPRSRWVSGHYCDEFAEAHAKNLLVRGALGAPLPLAGVGCAIARNLMDRLAEINNGVPFNQNSLTEDYEMGIRIGAIGGRTILVRIMDKHGRLVGTRACFPGTLSTSVRQKTRWLIGIALTGWDRLGWQGNFAQKWMLLQDRKSIFAAIVSMAAYLSIALTALLAIAETQEAYAPSAFPPSLIWLLWMNFVFFLWRLGVRAGFVAVLYGPKEALLSIPRSFVSNIIAIMAAKRATEIYIRHCFGAPLNWDKTVHQFVPDAEAERN